MTKALVIIPARYQSSRFPAKPLTDIAGKPMIQRVFEGVAEGVDKDQIIIATDSRKIFHLCKSFGARVEMTSNEHTSGTARVLEVIARHPEYDVYVNVQGDEPLMNGNVINNVLEPFESAPFPGIVTLAKARQDKADFNDPNVVKVVFDKLNRALYFSRSPIPYHIEGVEQWYQHIGIYAFSKYAIECVSEQRTSLLSEAENLEQLQWMECGTGITVSVCNETLIPVDVPSDVRKVVNYLRNSGAV